jgi:S-adenosylmethionine hydrolase
MLITLTTDFGDSDWFVGSMKGVIAGIAPDARVIDINHKVSPGNLVDGAFTLASSSPYFPVGTIHVAVIDPGVGSPRRAIALRTSSAVFIGPDNGVLSWAVRDAPSTEVRSLTNSDWFLEPVSQTFHGRDIFAPVAARLSAGAPFEDAGDPVDDYVVLPWPGVTAGSHQLSGQVVYIDRFGNAITNLSATDFPAGAPRGSDVEVRCGSQRARVHPYYNDVPRGKALAIFGSSGLLELALNGNDFAEQHGIEVGSPVTAQW